MEGRKRAPNNSPPSSESLVREKYTKVGINTDAIDIILESRRPATRRQYNTYINQWNSYCTKNKYNPIEPYLANVLDFLTELYKKGLSYSAINTARSRLSSIIEIEGKPVGEHPHIVRFVKGVFNLRPSLPKTRSIWDPEVVLNVLRDLSPLESLTMKQLTLKCLTLLWLLSAQRGQSMQLIDVRNISITDDEVKITFGDLLKTSRPGFHQQDICLKSYKPDKRLCIVTTISEYITRRKSICPKNCNQLFISYQKPHHPVTASTIARWVKEIMQMSGLNTNIFTPHSLRAASTSAAMRASIPIDCILATAGWKKDSTFRKYYNKPLTSNLGYTVIT